MEIGYAVASTSEQNLKLQYDPLNSAGCTRILANLGLLGANTTF